MPAIIHAIHPRTNLMNIPFSSIVCEYTESDFFGFLEGNDTKKNKKNYVPIIYFVKEKIQNKIKK